MNDAQQRTLELSTYIKEKIAQQGDLSFSDYMQLALYHPSLGYYNNGSQKFGKHGDFITAPEISVLFGQCIATHIAPILAQLNNADILEFGAGSGQLAVDILQTLAKINQLPSHYYILELSAELQHRQREKIRTILPSDLHDKVIWLTTLPEHFKGVMLANEVLDAMPVDRFCFYDGKLWEYLVSYQENELREKLAPASKKLTDTLAKYAISFSEGYQSEINLQLPAWINALSATMTQGLVLLIDYGFPRHEYYHPDRSMGTLMCHYQHTTETNPYLRPGLQDMTAHVDFTAVSESAIAAGFEIAGYTTQAHFLLNCGLMDLAAKQPTSTEEYWAMSQAIKKLVLPSEMGEFFKVMTLTKALPMP